MNSRNWIRLKSQEDYDNILRTRAVGTGHLNISPLTDMNIRRLLAQGVAVEYSEYPQRGKLQESIRYLGALVAPFEDGEFVPVAQRIPVGHTFEHEGAEWRCVWCEPGRIGYVALLMPIDS